MRTQDQVAFGVEQAAEAINIGTSTLRKYLSAGVLPAHNVGDRKLILRSDLEQFVRSNPSLPR
jgi:excisionase family DNA binding protein